MPTYSMPYALRGKRDFSLLIYGMVPHKGINHVNRHESK